jgi:hypothetical protein
VSVLAARPTVHLRSMYGTVCFRVVQHSAIYRYSSALVVYQTPSRDPTRLVAGLRCQQLTHNYHRYVADRTRYASSHTIRYHTEICQNSVNSGLYFPTKKITMIFLAVAAIGFLVCKASNNSPSSINRIAVCCQLFRVQPVLSPASQNTRTCLLENHTLGVHMVYGMRQPRS